MIEYYCQVIPRPSLGIALFKLIGGSVTHCCHKIKYVLEVSHNNQICPINLKHGRAYRYTRMKNTQKILITPYVPS